MYGRNQTIIRRWANMGLAIVFVMGITIPCLGTIFGTKTGGIPGENRSAAPVPTISLDALGKFPEQAENWFNDYFGFRNLLVKTHNYLLLKLARLSSRSDVIVGHPPWLFYNADHIVDVRRGLQPFGEDELIAWQRHLEVRRDWLASHGIKYLFIVAPEKSSIYAEYLPAGLAPKNDNQWRLNQLVEWMRRHSTVPFLDLRSSLLAAKSRVRIYQWTDTHWNDEGAFAAYRQIADWLRGQYPSVKVLNRNDFQQQVRIGPGGDLAGMLALKDVLEEKHINLVPKFQIPMKIGVLTKEMDKHRYTPDHAPVILKRDAGEISRALIIHDSFFVKVMPYLSQHFDRAAFIWWDFMPDVILDEKPDIVIEEVVERVLSRPIQPNPPKLSSVETTTKN